mgnify:CR=1 FL=1
MAIADVVVEDGFILKYANIDELGQPHMNYPGFRVSLDVSFGDRMRDGIHVDIGVGDAVDPKKESLELYQYRGKPVFEGAVSLQVYPVETIFAEKIEAVISWGAANSRMKDYHDVLLLCREDRLLDIPKLRHDIQKTFGTRNTQWKSPIVFSDDEYDLLQGLWSRHISGLGDIASSLGIPDHIEDVVAEINRWVGLNLKIGGNE